MAVSINARWEYAWGKFPNIFFVLKSKSSLNKPRWLEFDNNWSKRRLALVFSPILKRLFMYQKVQTVKDDLGSPKSSLFLYLNNKPS